MKRELLTLLLVPAIPALQQRVDATLGEYRAQEEVLYLASGASVKRLVPAGFELIMADLYWLRTVQYFGGQRLYDREKRFELLQPLIEITTTLDPKLDIAYRYGAIFLAEPAPFGAGRPRDAIAVLEKGTRALPHSWRLRQELGFFHFLYLHDSHTAARVLVEASAIPGAAPWLKSMAADLLQRGGDRQTSRHMWRQIFDQSEEGILRANAREQLKILDALDQADRLEALVAEHERRLGRKPRSLEELRVFGLDRRALADPNGVPFEYDAMTGRVKISMQSKLWRPEQ